jgi:hypothetical protein
MRQLLIAVDGSLGSLWRWPQGKPRREDAPVTRLHPLRARSGVAGAGG